MGNSGHKIFVAEGKYIYRYQFRFLKNIIKSEPTFSSNSMKEYIDKFVVYNLISDLEKQDEGIASLVWYEDEETVAFQFPQDGKVMSELTKIGYEFPELYDEEEW